jgi:hypothetical protein
MASSQPNVTYDDDGGFDGDENRTLIDPIVPEGAPGLDFLNGTASVDPSTTAPPSTSQANNITGVGNSKGSTGGSSAMVPAVAAGAGCGILILLVVLLVVRRRRRQSKGSEGKPQPPPRSARSSLAMLMQNPMFAGTKVDNPAYLDMDPDELDDGSTMGSGGEFLPRLDPRRGNYGSGYAEVGSDGTLYSTPGDGGLYDTATTSAPYYTLPVASRTGTRNSFASSGHAFYASASGESYYTPPVAMYAQATQRNSEYAPAALPSAAGESTDTDLSGGFYAVPMVGSSTDDPTSMAYARADDCVENGGYETAMPGAHYVDQLSAYSSPGALARSMYASPSASAYGFPSDEDGVTYDTPTLVDPSLAPASPRV